jgi:hypothetical protein
MHAGCLAGSALQVLSLVAATGWDYRQSLQACSVCVRACSCLPEIGSGVCSSSAVRYCSGFPCMRTVLSLCWWSL